MASDRPTAQGQPGGEDRRCSHCGTSHTSGHWRRHPSSGQSLCKACSSYALKHGGQLPPGSVLQRRPVQPRRMEEVRSGMAQRHCLQCGSSSPGSGERARWRRHPATGEEWVCESCRSRIYRQLKKTTEQLQPQAGSRFGITGGADEQQEQAVLQQGQSHRRKQQGGSNEAGLEEGEQAPPAAPPHRQQPKRQRQQEAADEGPAAFHAGLASAARKSALGSGGAGEEPVQLKVAPQGQAGGSGKGTQPTAKRQRRKQAQPQHLPPEPPHQLEQQASLPATLLAPAQAAAEPTGSEGPAAASLNGAMAAAGDAAAAGTASVGSLGGSAPQQTQRAAAQQAEHLQPPPQPPEPEQDLFDLLQQAMEVVAAAASGLTPELVAAFAVLPPLEARREGFLRHLLQRRQHSAAAAFMTTALRGAGHLPPATG